MSTTADAPNTADSQRPAPVRRGRGAATSRRTKITFPSPAGGGKRPAGSRGRPGRPPKEIDPNGGPGNRFAIELRELREQAGAPSYREMGERVNYNRTTLCEAALGGDTVPSWFSVEAYVKALDGNVAVWATRYVELCKAVGTEPHPQAVEASSAARQPRTGPAPGRYPPRGRVQTKAAISAFVIFVAVLIQIAILLEPSPLEGLRAAPTVTGPPTAAAPPSHPSNSSPPDTTNSLGPDASPEVAGPDPLSTAQQNGVYAVARTSTGGNVELVADPWSSNPSVVGEIPSGSPIFTTCTYVGSDPGIVAELTRARASLALLYTQDRATPDPKTANKRNALVRGLAKLESTVSAHTWYRIKIPDVDYGEFNDLWINDSYVSGMSHDSQPPACQR